MRARVVGIAAVAVLAIGVAVTVWMFKAEEEPFPLGKTGSEFGPVGVRSGANCCNGISVED